MEHVPECKRQSYVISIDKQHDPKHYRRTEARKHSRYGWTQTKAWIMPYALKRVVYKQKSVLADIMKTRANLQVTANLQMSQWSLNRKRK